MKILRISTVPISLETFLKGQLRMLNQHYEIIGVSSPGEALDKVHQREGIRVIPLPMERRISLIKDFISLIRMIFLLIKERPDMIHSITPKAGLISMLAGWITRVPVRMHTFTGLVFPTATGFKQKILIMMDRLTCACATHINPEGNGVKNDLIKYRITSKPLHIIANGNISGIDLIHYQRTTEILSQARQYREEHAFTFCFVGRMVRDKGINELVSAFVKLHQKFACARLILVGPFERELDPIDKSTEEQILHHPAIVFMDFQKDIRPFMAASDALVFPSYREGFSMVIQQAMAMGIAVVTTDIPGPSEVIEENVSGLLAEAKDSESLSRAMEKLLQDDVLRTSMAHEGYNRARKLFERGHMLELTCRDRKRILQDL